MKFWTYRFRQKILNVLKVPRQEKRLKNNELDKKSKLNKSRKLLKKNSGLVWLTLWKPNDREKCNVTNSKCPHTFLYYNISVPLFNTHTLSYAHTHYLYLSLSHTHTHKHTLSYKRTFNRSNTHTSTHTFIYTSTHTSTLAYTHWHAHLILNSLFLFIT